MVISNFTAPSLSNHVSEFGNSFAKQLAYSIIISAISTFNNSLIGNSAPKRTGCHYIADMKNSCLCCINLSSWKHMNRLDKFCHCRNGIYHFMWRGSMAAYTLKRDAEFICGGTGLFFA